MPDFQCVARGSAAAQLLLNDPLTLLARHRYIISRFAETFIRDEIEIEQMMLSLAHCPLSLIENISSSLLMD
jgi:hypothetical protein